MFCVQHPRMLFLYSMQDVKGQTLSLVTSQSYHSTSAVLQVPWSFLRFIQAPSGSIKFHQVFSGSFRFIQFHSGSLMFLQVLFLRSLRLLKKSWLLLDLLFVEGSEILKCCVCTSACVKKLCSKNTSILTYGFVFNKQLKVLRIESVHF